MAALNIFNPKQTFVDKFLSEKEAHVISQTFVHVYKNQVPNTAVFIFRGEFSYGSERFQPPKLGSLVFFFETLKSVDVKESFSLTKGSTVLFLDKKACLELSSHKPLQDFLNKILKT